ncbi:MAG: hypothetical protein ACJAQ3_002952 [Planctomycetota bacterium]|jgi:hypothetical protein
MLFTSALLVALPVLVPQGLVPQGLATHIGTPRSAPAAQTPSGEAPTADEVQKAIHEAALFLLGSQESYKPDPPVGGLSEAALGKWQAKESQRMAKIRGGADAAEWPYEGVYRVRPDGRIPAGYRVGGSAIVAEALLNSGLEGEPLKEARQAVQRTISFVIEQMDSNEELSRGPKAGYDVRGWGHAYAIQLMLLALDHGLVEGEEAEEARELIVDLLDRLQANMTKQGGWNYAGEGSVSPFMTGATLLILFDAKAHGFEVDAEMVNSALEGLEKGTTDAMIYAYAGRAGRRVKMPASSARSSIATLALYKAGRKTQDDLRLAVQGFFDGWDDLLVRKSQQGTHIPPYNIAPYYFFFGHTYAAMAIEELPDGEKEARRGELAGLLWKTREEDGTWNDRIFPRTSSYSTAMSILALRAPELEAIPVWE